MGKLLGQPVFFCGKLKFLAFLALKLLKEQALPLIVADRITEAHLAGLPACMSRALQPSCRAGCMVHNFLHASEAHGPLHCDKQAQHWCPCLQGCH